MKNNKIIFLFIVVLLISILSSCSCISLKNNPSAKAVDGGIYKSSDRGSNWLQKETILTTDKKEISIGNTGITDIEFDPQDSQTSYGGKDFHGYC